MLLAALRTFRSHKDVVNNMEISISYCNICLSLLVNNGQLLYSAGEYEHNI